jgi:hypothetical protein
MNNNKIYVKIPAGEIAGGIESLYQLVDSINNLRGNAIVLWDNNMHNPVPSVYYNYYIKQEKTVDDNPNNMIIYPEVWTDNIYEYENLKKCIWWLSVDNNHNKFNNFHDKNITHFYQSFYALNHLIKNESKTYLPLFDYISDDYINEKYNINDKQNIVCYNPAKGLDITENIIYRNNDIIFVPIYRMTRQEIIKLLKISKVYIDFGNHPGRDRIPREAAYLGNIVITNNKGSAYYYNDMPVQQKYKLEDYNEVGDLIRDCFVKYNDFIDDFKVYRSHITNQKNQLINLCKQNFCL